MGWEREPEQRHSYRQALNPKQKETGRHAHGDMPGLLPSACPPFSCCWPNLTGNQLSSEPKKQTQGVGPITNRTARERQGMGLRRITPLQTWNSSQFRLLIQCGQQERYYLWKSNTSTQKMFFFLEIMEGDGDNYFSSSYIKMEKQALP